jgi:ribosomal protein S18 acetylase RimI-like enzyme
MGDAIRIRQATAADATGIARVDVETWRSAYAGLLPNATLVGMSVRRRAATWSGLLLRGAGDTIVAADPQAGIVGFGTCGRRRERGSDLAGEIFTLYVAPDFQGEGLGRRLLLGLFARLLGVNLPSAIVWVLRDNPSRFFYERLGGRLVGRRVLDVGGAKVEAVAYGWPDLVSVLKARTDLPRE